MSDTPNRLGKPISLATTGGAVQPFIEEGAGSPNGVLTRPEGSLYLRTDVAQLWQNTGGGAAWTQIASGSMGAHFATDAFIYFGDNDNYQIGYVSNIVPYLPFVPPVPLVPGWLISSTLVDDTPGPGLASAVSVGTQATLATGAGVTGKISGYLVFTTGDTDAEPGNTGGGVGGMVFQTGRALGSVNGSGGTSGDSFDMQFGTGPSDDGKSGTIKFVTGDGKTGSGGFEWRIGTYTVAGGVPGFEFYGTIDPAGKCSAMVLSNVSLVGSLVAGAGDGQSTPALVKIFTFGAVGGTIYAQKISLGSAGGPPLNAHGYVMDVKVVKTGGAANAGDVVEVKTGVSTICTVPLNGVVAGDAQIAGLGGIAFDPSIAIVDGNSFTVQTNGGGGGDCSCVVYVTYAQG